MKILSFFLIVSLLSAMIVSCASVRFAGNGSSGYRDFPENAISPQEAHRRAEPYLEKTYELRKKGRNSTISGKPYVMIVIKGDWYYVTLDNYPYKTLHAYCNHAVRVHVQTGEIIPPE